jgi:hypothetical protein
MKAKLMLILFVLIIGLSIAAMHKLDLYDMKYSNINGVFWGFSASLNTLFICSTNQNITDNCIWSNVGDLKSLIPYLTWRDWHIYIEWSTYLYLSMFLTKAASILPYTSNISLIVLIFCLSFWHIARYLWPIAILCLFTSLSIFTGINGPSYYLLVDMLRFNILVLISLPCFLYLIYFIWNHKLPKLKRWTQDFFKIDPDNNKKNQLDIHKSVSTYRDHDRAEMTIKNIDYGYFLGVWNDTTKPIILPEQSFRQHLHVLGGTGAGKTSRVLLPLALQAISRGRGVLYLDWKGDRQSIASIHELAELNSKRFYYLSLTHESHNWNILEGDDPLQIAERLIIALDISFDGPAKFYTMLQKSFLSDLISEFQKKGLPVTAKDIYNALSDEHTLSSIVPQWCENRSSLEQLKGLKAALAPIASIPQLNSHHPDFAITEVVSNEDVLYAHLSSQAFPNLAGTIGKLICMCLESTASFRTPNHPLFFVILDEFHDCACQSQLNLITKIRDASYALVLANQSEGQLIRPELGGRAYLQSLKDSVNIKIVFRRYDGNEAENWAKSTGTEPFQQRGTQIDDGSLTNNTHHTILDGKRVQSGFVTTQYKPLITSNTLLTLPDGCALVLGLPDHLPGIASFAHPWSKEKKLQLESRPWPLDTDTFHINDIDGLTTRCAEKNDEGSLSRNVVLGSSISNREDFEG